MFKFPDEFDGSFLLGKTLEMVCFNTSQVYLHFDERVRIMIESAFSYHRRENSDETEIINKVPVKKSNLMQLLGQKVSGVQTDNDATMTLKFENGDIVKCYATFPNYECYHIWNGTTEVII